MGEHEMGSESENIDSGILPSANEKQPVLEFTKESIANTVQQALNAEFHKDRLFGEGGFQDFISETLEKYYPQLFVDGKTEVFEPQSRVITEERSFMDVRWEWDVRVPIGTPEEDDAGQGVCLRFTYGYTMTENNGIQNSRVEGVVLLPFDFVEPEDFLQRRAENIDGQIRE